MTDPADSHAVDVETFRFGVVFAVLGVVLGPLMTILGVRSLGADTAAAVLGLLLLLIPGLCGLLCLVVGIRAFTLPTAKATVNVDADGVTVVRRNGREARFGWDAVEDWGLARRLFGITRSLVLRPRSAGDTRQGDAADALWRGRLGGWVLEAVDPEPALLSTLERLAPRPRRDTE